MAAVIDETDPESEDPQEAATRLLERALRLGQEKDDADWLHSSAVKSQMRRMDPAFSERALGYRSFSDFVKSRAASRNSTRRTRRGSSGSIRPGPNGRNRPAADSDQTRQPGPGAGMQAGILGER